MPLISYLSENEPNYCLPRRAVSASTALQLKSKYVEHAMVDVVGVAKVVVTASICARTGATVTPRVLSIVPL